MEPIVRFQDAGVSLGGRSVLRGIDLAVSSGQSVGVAGPNGSGKTTLIRLAATLLSADRGIVEVLGRDTTNPDLVEVRGSIGLIGHQPALIPELSLLENLQHVGNLTGIDSSRISRALEVVGLGETADRRANACSFGMKRRAEIAHLLLTKPRLLLLDEAASGLDDSARGLIKALVNSVRERGGGSIVVSHDRAQLTDLTSQVLTLSPGGLEVAQ